VHARTFLSDPDNLVDEWIGSHTTFLQQKVFPGYAGPIAVSTHLSQYPIQTMAQGGEPSKTIGSFEHRRLQPMSLKRLSLLDYAIRYFDVAGEPREIPYPQAIQAQGQTPMQQDGVAPGKIVSVALVWEPLREMDVLKTSLRLVDQRGLVWDQRDQEPFMYLPTSEWPIGARVHHEADLRISPGTPPGIYRLQLWVYEKASGRPLSFGEPGTPAGRPYLELGQVTVASMHQSWPIDAFLPDGVRRPWPRPVFGGRLELMAHSTLPETIQASETLDLSLYWRARKAPGQDCDLMVNWVNEKGVVWHTNTHSLTGKDYPASRWQKGEMVRGLVRLTVPAEAPQGEHTVHLLVHSRESQSYLWLGRGWLPWTGRDLEIGRVTVE